MDRRKFAQIGLLGLLCLFLAKISFAQDSTISYPFRTLPEAFRALEFDPAIKGNSFFVVTADVHYGYPESDGIRSTIEDINKMDPKPDFLCLNGDMIIHASTHFGVVPNEKDYQMAIKEYQQFKSDADKLDRQVSLKLVLGNHDTHPREIDPDIFWKVFPGYPAYQSMNLEGVHLIFLNGHSTGYIDIKQMQWLEKDIRAISRKQTVVIFIHQPSLSHRVGERGIPSAISKAFENHKGQVWLLGGHEHTNFQEIFQLKNTRLIEHGITCGANNIWGGSERPGYWIYCLRSGQIAGRIFKQRTKGYRIEPLPDLTQARAIPMPFDNCTDIVWKLFVGEGDRNYRVEAKAENCLNYWAYVKELTYCLPLKETNNSARTIALLTDHRSQNAARPSQYFVSSDLQKWQEIPLEEAKEELLLFTIPKTLQGDEKIYFKFIPSGEASVGGFALLK